MRVVAVIVCGPGGVFFSSRRRHTRCSRDWSSDVCSSDLPAGDRKGADEGKHKCLPAKIPCDRHGQGTVKDKGDQRVVMPPGATEKGLDAHPVNEHRYIREGNRKRMASRKVSQPFRFGCSQEPLPGGDRERAHAGAKKACIVVMVGFV